MMLADSPRAPLSGDRDLDLDAGFDVDDDLLDKFGRRVETETMSVAAFESTPSSCLLRCHRSPP